MATKAGAVTRFESAGNLRVPEALDPSLEFRNSVPPSRLPRLPVATAIQSTVVDSSSHRDGVSTSVVCRLSSGRKIESTFLRLSAFGMFGMSEGPMLTRVPLRNGGNVGITET